MKALNEFLNEDFFEDRNTKTTKELTKIFRKEFGLGGFPFDYYQDGKKIIINPEGFNPDGTLFDMKDDWKGDIIKAIRKHKKNWQSKPNFGGGITIYIKESSEEINESILITTSVLLALSGIWMKYDSPYEDEGLSGWWKKKVVPKLQSFMSTDKKINQIINKLKNNPNAIEEITNASEKDKTETIKKYIDSKDFDYISKIISKIKR